MTLNDFKNKMLLLYRGEKRKKRKKKRNVTMQIMRQRSPTTHRHDFKVEIHILEVTKTPMESDKRYVLKKKKKIITISSLYA